MLAEMVLFSFSKSLAAFKYLRSGDTLVIWKLDRLGRTVKGLVDFVEELQAKGIQFRSLICCHAKR